MVLHGWDNEESFEHSMTFITSIHECGTYKAPKKKSWKTCVDGGERDWHVKWKCVNKITMLFNVMFECEKDFNITSKWCADRLSGCKSPRERGSIDLLQLPNRQHNRMWKLFIFLHIFGTHNQHESIVKSKPEEWGNGRNCNKLDDRFILNSITATHCNNDDVDELISNSFEGGERYMSKGKFFFFVAVKS